MTKKKLMTYYPATETTPEYITDGKTNYYQGPARAPHSPECGPQMERRAGNLLELFNDPTSPRPVGV